MGEFMERADRKYEVYVLGRQRFPRSGVYSLLKRAKKGDESAADEIYRIYGSKVRRFANKYFNEIFKDDAVFSVDDLTQEGFLALQKLIKTYDFKDATAFNLKLNNSVVEAFEKLHLYGMRSQKEKVQSEDRLSSGIDGKNQQYSFTEDKDNMDVSSGSLVSRNISGLDTVDESLSLEANQKIIAKVREILKDCWRYHPRKIQVIIEHCLNQAFQADVAKKIGVSFQRIHQLKQEGMEYLQSCRVFESLFSQYLDGSFADDSAPELICSNVCPNLFALAESDLEKFVNACGNSGFDYLSDFVVMESIKSEQRERAKAKKEQEEQVRQGR